MFGAEDIVVVDLVQRDAGFEFGIGRAREDVHVVPRLLPFFGEVGGIDSLTATEHVSAISK